MRKICKTILPLLLVGVILTCFSACGNPKNGMNPVAAKPERSGLWKNAVYIDDTELGQGSNTAIVDVKADGKAIRLTVHSDKKTVGAALLENGVLAGEDGPYGLFISAVNGITADYDTDKSYWAFFVNGQYASSSADQTDITQGDVYRFEYTK